MTPNILADFPISKALPLALSETVSKLLSPRKSILSSLHLSQFSLNLLSLDQRRTSCIVSWSIDAPNLGTISETVVSSANFHMEERVLLNVRSLIITKKSRGPIRGSLWNSGRDWLKVREAIRIKFDTLISVS